MPMLTCLAYISPFPPDLQLLVGADIPKMTLSGAAMQWHGMLCCLIKLAGPGHLSWTGAGLCWW